MSSNVLESIVNNHRMPVLFIGAGISRRYLHRYPNWEQLLKYSYTKISDDPYDYQGHLDSLSRKYDNQFDINVNLASIIEDEFNKAFYSRKINLNIGGKNPQWVNQHVSPYKMYLAHFFKKMKLHHNTYLKEELNAFRSLKNKISAIITTNYDLFLENEIFSDDYQVFCHQNELFSADSYNIAEIYKIHGCALDANSILITKKDYDNFNNTRKLFIAKMLTLFAESPIIFLGYSFTDKNIQEIIADFLSCLTEKELENIENHFVFISYKKGEMELKEIKRIITTHTGTQIPITEIETDNYLLIYETLNKITPGISPSRIRETKMLVKTIVEQNTANENINSIIIDIDDLSKVDLRKKPLAIAIGKKETLLGKLGYGVFSTTNIVEDILFDNKSFDCNAMCQDRFKSIASNRLIPVFKYVAGCSSYIDPKSKLQKYIDTHDTYEKIVTKNIEKTLKNIPNVTDIQDLHTIIDSAPDFMKKAAILLKNIKFFDISVIKKECQKLFSLYGDNEYSTHFLRCVMYVDLIENKKEN